MKKIIVAIPSYNEELTISSVIEKINKVQIPNMIIKIIVIDDGSTDNTKDICARHGVDVFSHQINMGVGRAFRTGLEKAIELGADYLVNIDADGQFDPSDIPRLIDPLELNKADFVSGNRFLDSKGCLSRPKNMPRNKYYGNIFMSNFISLLVGKKYSDVSCGFRAYSSKAMITLNLTGRFTYTQETFIDLSFKELAIVMIPVKVKYFPSRKSLISSNLFLYGFKTFKIIIRSFRDYKPLIFFVSISFPLLFIGLLCAIFILVYYILYSHFSPYKFVAYISVYSLSLTFILWITGLLADMFVRVRLNQEKILYYLRAHSTKRK